MRFKFFPAITLVASFFFISCNSDEKTTSDETVSTDSTSAAVSTPEPQAEPGDLVILKAKVANFAKWKASYDLRDSIRQAYGLHNFLVARGLKDTNRVMVVLRMDDTTKARQYFDMPELKAAMKKGGIIGAPSVLYLDVRMQDASPGASPTRVIVTHKVKDWDAWKKVFDSHKQVRLDAGLTDRAIGYSIGDNHTVTVAFIINDLKKAEAFMASQDLKDKMAEAGVVGPPDIFFYNVVQTY